jgi:O-antigen/teichoic acid export membrane protein
MVESMHKSPLARSAAWMFAGQSLRIIMQALYFVEIARALGVSRYGAFVGVVAMVGIASPFGDFGSGALLIKSVSRDRNCFEIYWGRALVTIIISSSMLLTIVLLVAHIALPSDISLVLVLLVAASDLFGLSVINTCGLAFMAFDRMRWVAAINALTSGARFAGATALIIIHPHPSAIQWGYTYFCTTTLVALTAAILVSSRLGLPRLNWRRSAAEAREGFYFAASLCAQTVYNDIDKTMLARLGTLEATGIYGAAYRLIDVSFVPVSSLLAASYSTLFRKGAEGIASCLVYAKPLLVRAVAYGLFVCFVLLASADLVPYILGPGYTQTAEALRWLSVLPMLKAVHYFLSNSLAGAGYQGFRTCVQLAVALFNIVLNLWLIPAYSWRGAAWSSVASDGLLVCGVGTVALVLSRRSRPAFAGVKADMAV